MKSQSTIRRFDSQQRFKYCISSKEAGSSPASFVWDKDSMERFEIQPVLSSAISDVAIFLHNWHAAEGRGSWVYRVTDDESAGVERRLRWLLLENPLASITPHHGFCIRNHQGFIVGVILSFPGAFWSGERRLVGLCSGSFFVEPQARAHGFFLFWKYLSSPGYDFFFGTTCNANSGALWKKLRGAPLEGSDAEYILPINFDVMFPAVLSTPNRIAEQAARLVGKCANPVAHTILKRQSMELALKPCRDWEKLSDLSRRHRPADLITTERSVAFLTWRYGKRSPNQSSEIYLFHDKIGNEGW